MIKRKNTHEDAIGRYNSIVPLMIPVGNCRSTFLTEHTIIVLRQEKPGKISEVSSLAHFYVFSE